MSVRRRWFHAALSLAFLASLLLFAAPAAAQNGGISGTVTNAVTTSPIGNLQILVFNAAGNFVTSVSTNATTGVYIASSLPAGSYFVRTSAGGSLNYINELYNDIPCGQSCTVTAGTAVPVTAGTTTSGINFALSPGGSVTGTVTETVNNTALSGISVSVFTAAGDFAGSGSSAANGTFTVGGLPTGSYRAITSVSNSQNYFNEAYDNVPCDGFCTLTSGTAFTVTAGAPTSGINFSLSPGGIITGAVTDGVAPIAGVGIVIYNAAGNFENSTSTNGSGVYTVLRLSTGSYFVQTSISGSQNLVDELYNNVTCVSCNPTSGTAIPVTAGTTTSGINFALAGGGTITGSVVNAANVPISDVNVAVYTSTGAFAGVGFTNGAGAFSVTGLPSGSYVARTFASYLNYLDELYNNLPCAVCDVTSGTPMVVTAGATTSGINFTLDPGGQITGVATDAVTHAPLESVEIDVWRADGTFVDNTYTSDTGAYTISGLPSGSYYVSSFFDNASSGLDYVGKLYGSTHFPDISGDQNDPRIDVTGGTPVAVTAGATTGAIDFALTPGGRIAGTVIDATTNSPLADVLIKVYTATGTFVAVGFTEDDGTFEATGVPAGSNVVRTSVLASLNYVDELYNDLPCAGCDVTTGTPVTVTVNNTTSGINFALSPGGAIAGTITDAVTNAQLSGVVVQVHNATGTFVKSAVTSGTGAFTIAGLPAGSYYARTAVPSSVNYVNKLYNNLPCAGGCTVTAGAAIVVTTGVTTSGINFALMPNLVQNGGFSNGTTGWKLFGAPNDTYMVSNTTGGSFNFRRTPQPGGTPVSQALLFQDTGNAVPSNTALLAQFDLANTASKVMVMRVLLVADSSNFGLDFAACTYAVPADGLTRTYGMKAHTTQAWPNAAIYFYATQIDASGGDYYYKVDNVTWQQAPGQSVERTECVDPLAPAPVAGPDSSNLLVNGDFSSGALAPGWGESGAITGRSPMVGGVYEFLRTAVFPPPVVLQQTNAALAPAGMMPAGQRLTLTLELSNSGPGRKRALVLVNDNDFSSFVACAWWLAPNQTPSAFAMQLYTTEAWQNPTVSIYPSAGSTDQWLRLDNVVLKKTPATNTSGPVCLEGSEAAALVAAGPPAGPPSMQGETFALDTLSAPQRSSPAATGTDVGGAIPVDDDLPFSPDDTWTNTSDGWEATATETAPLVLRWHEPFNLTGAIEARLTFESQLAALDSRAEVQVSPDGGLTWLTVSHVTPTDTWQPVEIDLGGFLGEVIEVRFLLDGVAPADSATPDTWRVRDVEITRTTASIAVVNRRNPPQPAAYRRSRE